MASEERSMSPSTQRAKTSFAEVNTWSAQFVQAVDSILNERARLTGRLEKIAAVLRE